VIVVVRQAVTGRITIGDVVLVLSLLAQVNNQLVQATASANSFAQMIRVAGRYLWLADYSKASLILDQPIPVPERLSRGIELAGVGFRYPGTDAEVLSDVNLVLPAGASVALVGDNGAGKSSLVKLLCRFYEPTEGSILVDGRELAGMDIDQWRSRLSGGFQDFARLELVARETVGVGDLPHMGDVTAVERALVRAGAADVVAGLPKGLETQVGRSFGGGIEPSGGQWQKLALARAMMRERPLLLVLDEPTAALDASSEHALFERYAGAARLAAVETGGITVLVSHRFSTVRMADLIVVVDGGGIADVGTHAELVARGGIYAELYELQARGYR